MYLTCYNTIDLDHAFILMVTNIHRKSNMQYDQLKQRGASLTCTNMHRLL